MSKNLFLKICNEKAFNIKGLPDITETEFRNAVAEKVRNGERLTALYGMPQDNQYIKIIAILANDTEGSFYLTSMTVDKTYQSITPICAQAHMFEREIAEQWGITPKGHPWLKPVRFHRSLSNVSDAFKRAPNNEILPADMDFYKVEGVSIHEVAVGPVHAGVIEPGHFRFQCDGEKVLHLEIALGYQHRGIEKALVGGPVLKSLNMIEVAAGDSTIAHATAYSRVLEAILGIDVSKRANAIRGIALELERMANHIGDLGALANDVAYLPTSSFCGRIRGDVLNMTARICGNRFGRRLLTVGGVKEDISEENRLALIELIKKSFEETENAISLLWKTHSVMSRFEGTGTVTSSICRLLGIVGMAARSSGLELDSRVFFPSGIFKEYKMPLAKCESGDVYARAMVRWLDIINSKDFILKTLTNMPQNSVTNKVYSSENLPPDMCSLSIIEGWRGEVLHIAITNKDGKFASYKVIDPSFHNWPALAMALRNEQISNFPLCNKSFNLSYCGHDL